MLCFGMTYELFWYGDMEAANFYIEKYKFETELFNNKTNISGWVIGSYVLEALAVVNQNPKGTKIVYPEEPHKISSDKHNNYNESELTDAEKNYAKMKLVAAAFNNRRKVKGKS